MGLPRRRHGQGGVNLRGPHAEDLGTTASFNLQKALWCVAEFGIPHQRIDAGGRFGVTDTPEYLAMNPNGRLQDREPCRTCVMLPLG